MYNLELKQEKGIITDICIRLHLNLFYSISDMDHILKLS